MTTRQNIPEALARAMARASDADLELAEAALRWAPYATAPSPQNVEAWRQLLAAAKRSTNAHHQIGRLTKAAREAQP
jgi:hypothetical protein